MPEGANSNHSRVYRPGIPDGIARNRLDPANGVEGCGNTLHLQPDTGPAQAAGRVCQIGLN